MSDSEEHSLDLSCNANKAYTIKVSCKDDALLEAYHKIDEDIRNELLKDADKKKIDSRTFNEIHPRDERGYGAWLSADANELDKDDSSDDETKNVESTIVDPDFNKKFEEKVVSGSHIDTDTLGLHPEQMGALSGATLGVNVKDDRSPTEVFTSMLNENPEFTDLYSAYTHDNTIIDKVATFDESLRPKTLEELIAEREATIDLSNTPETIVAYEKKKLEEEFERERLLRDHFDPTGSERKWLTNNSFLHDFSSVKAATENVVVDS
jgi:hypothetical protein